MKKNEQIATLLDRFMAAETTELEESLLAEYFRTATDIPDEWQPYADMFRIFGNGATRLTDSESGSCTDAPRAHRNQHLHKWAASIAIACGLSAVAAGLFFDSSIVSIFSDDATESPMHAAATSLTETPDSPTPDFFVFDNVEMQAVADTIARHYSLTPVFEDEELMHKRIYLKVNKQKTIQEVVEQLNQFDKICATISDGKLIIR